MKKKFWGLVSKWVIHKRGKLELMPSVTQQSGLIDSFIYDMLFIVYISHKQLQIPEQPFGLIWFSLYTVAQPKDKHNIQTGATQHLLPLQAAGKKEKNSTRSETKLVWSVDHRFNIAYFMTARTKRLSAHCHENVLVARSNLVCDTRQFHSNK